MQRQKKSAVVTNDRSPSGRAMRSTFQSAALLAATLLSTGGALLLQGLSSVSLAAPETAKRANVFVHSIGVNVHLTYTGTAYGNYEGIIKPKLRELGVKHIRDGGFYDQDYFGKLKDLANYRIYSTLQFYGTPVNEAVGMAKNDLPGAIEIIEGPNEPDISASGNFSYNGQGFPEGVRNYQNDLYNAVNADPATASLPVLMTSMGWGENAGTLGRLDSADIGNMHSYTNNGERPTFDIDWYFIPQVRKIIGDTKPLMSTETGYHNLTSDALGVSERSAGKYIPRLLLENFNRNIKRTYLYELIDQHPDPDNANKELHYGLLRNDGSEKPAFTAIKNLIAVLKDPGPRFKTEALDYSLGGDTTDLHHTLLQKRNGDFYLILWQDAKSWDNTNKQDVSIPSRKVTVTLNTVITKAEVYEPNNSTSSILQYSGPSGDRLKELSLDVPDHPLVIKLSK